MNTKILGLIGITVMLIFMGCDKMDNDEMNKKYEEEIEIYKQQIEILEQIVIALQRQNEQKQQIISMLEKHNERLKQIEKAIDIKMGVI